MEDWKKDLKSFFEVQKIEKRLKDKDDEIKSQVEKFYSTKVRPTLKELKKELERYGREVKIAIGHNFAAIEVSHMGRLELNYQIKVKEVHPYPEVYYQDRSGNGIWAEGSFKLGVQKYTIQDISKEVIIGNFMREYKARLWVLYKRTNG
jgi:hypothetical protein